jgi:hypothetical protein
MNVKERKKYNKTRVGKHYHTSFFEVKIIVKFIRKQI